MFDILQASFWSITYVLLIVYAIKYKTHGIPLTAICLNYGWETVALIRSLFVLKTFSLALLVHIAWFSLDTIIVALFLFHETPIVDNIKQKALFLFSLLATIASCFVLFNIGGMLLSCFAIDLIMAVAFLAFAFREEVVFSPLSITIGIAKFIGDTFAWLCYRDNPIVNIIGIVVLLCNIAYVLILLRIYYRNKIKNKIVQEDEK